MNKFLIISKSLFFWAFLNLSCSDNHHSDSYKNTNDYKVYKIDSIKNYYLIYALKKNVRFKIISSKEFNENCKEIKQESYYDFRLTSLLHSFGVEEIAPGSAGCVYVDSVTKICIEDSIYDLYSGDNIKGLCFTQNH